MDKELDRSILSLSVCCSLGCQWIGELRHLERHLSPAKEGDCPLVEVMCDHGCGQIMKRQEREEHEEEMCSKRPLDFQLSRLQSRMERTLTELQKKHDLEISALKTIVEEQRDEISKLKTIVHNSKSKAEAVCMTYAYLKPSSLQIMPKLPGGNIPGVMYHAEHGRVEIYGSCDAELRARCFLFQIEYQKILLAVRTKKIELPPSYPQRELDDMLIELNQKYASSYIFIEEKCQKPAIRIFSVLPSQVEEIAKFLQLKLKLLHVRTVHLSGNRKVTLKMCDITKEEVDIIVNAANTMLNHQTRGVAGALNKATNGELQRLSDKYISDYGRLQIGGVAVTKGCGNLKCKFVLHLAGPKASHTFSDGDASGILRKGIRNVLSEAEKLGAVSIAIPAIGAGSYLLKNDMVASSIMSAIKEYSYTSETAVNDIRVIVYNDNVYSVFIKVFES